MRFALHAFLATLVFGISFSSSTFSQENKEFERDLLEITSPLNEPKRCVQKQSGGDNSTALDDKPPFDVSQFSALKGTYFSFRCSVILKPITDSYFEKFEKEGLVASEMAQKARELQNNKAFKESAKIVDQAMLSLAIAGLDEAAKNPETKDIKLKCNPDCANEKIKCSYKKPNEDWKQLPDV